MKLLFTIITFLAVVACKSQQQTNGQKQEFVFRSVNVIPMDKEVVLKNQTVVVKDGKITAMGDASKIRFNKEATVIDGRGRYLIPGLAEMHAHVPPVDDLQPMKEVLTLFAVNGITTIRGMLGHPKHLELRSKIQSGEIAGPRFTTSGPSFNGNTAKDPAIAADMVRQQKAAGYDFLKLHPGITKESFAAIAKTAKEVNIPFAGHVSFDVGVWRAIDAGYATIDHLDGFIESLVPAIEETNEQQNGLFAMFIADKADTTKITKLVSSLKENNIWVVPTQALAERWFAPGKTAEEWAKEPEMKYMDSKTVSNWIKSKKSLMNNARYNPDAMTRFIALRRKLIYECQKNGAQLLLGSDAPQVFDVPGFSTHQELKYMVDAGLTPFEALQTGTVNVARFLKRTDMGTIKNGAVSDVILLNDNPLTNIENTRKIEGVMLGSKWLSKKWIDDELKKLEKR